MRNFKYLLFLSILCSLVLFTNCGEDSEDPVADDPTNNTDDDTDDGSTDPVNYTLTLSSSEGEAFVVNVAVELASIALASSSPQLVNNTSEQRILKKRRCLKCFIVLVINLSLCKD